MNYNFSSLSYDGERPLVSKPAKKSYVCATISQLHHNVSVMLIWPSWKAGFCFTILPCKTREPNIDSTLFTLICGWYRNTCIYFVKTRETKAEICRYKMSQKQIEMFWLCTQVNDWAHISLRACLSRLISRNFSHRSKSQSRLFLCFQFILPQQLWTAMLPPWWILEALEAIPIIHGPLCHFCSSRAGVLLESTLSLLDSL